MGPWTRQTNHAAHPSVRLPRRFPGLLRPLIVLLFLLALLLVTQGSGAADIIGLLPNIASC